MTKQSLSQLLTGRKELSKLTVIAPSTIEKILKYLEKGQQIEQQKTNKFRIITILRWQYYQTEGQQKEHQNDNNMTTKEQQCDTYKNDKNEKNENNQRGVDSCRDDKNKLIDKWLDDIKREGLL